MPRLTWKAAAWAAFALFSAGARADEVLATSTFENCNTSSSIVVNEVSIKYDNSAKQITFNVAGTSSVTQNVSALLNVTAYGVSAYQKSFNPCESDTYVAELCPVPKGAFSASGSQAIPESYANAIPALAFSVPDIDAKATLQLNSLDGEPVGCVSSEVTNGKTASVPAVSYVAAGVAGAALLVSSASALMSGAGAAAGGMGAGAGPSPSFGEIFGVFQGFAMNGMMSVNYPSVYRSFTKNFAFATGLVPWTTMQLSIDDFRQATGGNLTNDSVQFLKNATLVFPDGTTTTASSSTLKRGFDDLMLAAREISASVGGSTATEAAGNATSSTEASIRAEVSGIKGYVEELSVPSANTFMTVLLIVAIVIGVIVVGVLLLKVILEAWALFASFPEGLKDFRKNYWRTLARTLTQMILLLYGVWVLYCIYQFVQGDSWAAKALAAVTLALFTGVLAFFGYKIWSTAERLKKAEGDPSGLYEDKDIWSKYSFFYDNYKKDYWWLFVPAITYMFAKGCVTAAGDGNGKAQVIAHFIVEGLMLILVLWSRPYERKSGNVVNGIIQGVRVLSVACIFVFVDEFGIAETTQTVVGVVLLVVQAVLSGTLAILVGWNAIQSCIKENPHVKRQREMEKLQRDELNLTPLDARNSLLLEGKAGGQQHDPSTTFSMSSVTDAKTRPLSRDSDHSGHHGYYGAEPANPYAAAAAGTDQSHDNLVTHAAPIGREPLLPNVETGYRQDSFNSNAGYNGYRNGY